MQQQCFAAVQTVMEITVARCITQPRPHAVPSPRTQELAPLLAARGVLRFVPVAEMHHFGPVWDGQEYWLRTFAIEAAA